MTDTVTDDRLSKRRSVGGAADQGFRGLALGAGLAVLVILATIAVVTTQRAWPAFTKLGGGYFFGTEWNPTANKYGILPLVYGTVVVSAVALIVAVPVSIGIALFLTELAPPKLRSLVVTVMDVLAAVPSVVFGLWALLVLRGPINGVYGHLHETLGGVPVIGRLFGPVSTLNLMTAGLIVALMITPIITSVTREVFATVPRNDKEGALALGATRWEMIKGVVFPHSSGGMVGAIMLGLGRAMGETIAVVLIIGASPRIAANLFGSAEAMPSRIARDLNEAGDFYRSVLIGLGVVLFVLTLAVNMASRRMVRIVDRRLQGAK